MALFAYSDVARREDLEDVLKDLAACEDVNVSISRAQNGYIFNVSGRRSNPNLPKNASWSDRYIEFRRTYVFPELKDGLAETQNYFDMIHEALTKATKKKKESSE